MGNVYARSQTIILFLGGPGPCPQATEVVDYNCTFERDATGEGIKVKKPKPNQPGALMN